MKFIATLVSCKGFKRIEIDAMDIFEAKRQAEQYARMANMEVGDVEQG